MEKISKVPKDCIINTYYLKGLDNNFKYNEEKLLGDRLVEVEYN